MEDKRPQVSVSRLLDYDRCPQYAHHKWHRNLRDPKESSSAALELGTAFHDRMAGKLLGSKPEPLADTGLEDNLHAQVLDIALEEWDRRFGTGPWNTLLMVEEPLVLPSLGFDWIGKPDAVVEWQGKLWHVQHKTLGGSRPVAVYVAGQAVSPHEMVYCEMLDAHFPDKEVAGTMLNIARKLSLKSARAEPHKLVHMEYMPIPKQRRESTVRRMAERVYNMLNDEADGTPPYRNQSACTGKYGNSLCGFYYLCWGGEKEEDFAKYNPLEYYEDGEPGAE